MNITVNGTPIDLPDPANIPVPKTKKAVEKLLDIITVKRDLRREVDAADSAFKRAQSDDRDRIADELFADPKRAVEGATDATAKAEAALGEARALYKGVLAAEGRAARELREVVKSEADAWAKIARADAAKAITKLTTATRMAATARDDLHDSLDVLDMLTRGVLVRDAKPQSYHFELNPAIDNLTGAIRSATDDLGALS